MRRWMLVVAAVGGLSAVSCVAGGNFDSLDKVTTLNRSQVCVSNTTGGDFVQCADLASIGHPEGMAVGTCVEVHHAGESARILRVMRVVDCPTPGSATTD
ncbi:MAG: hypothetical protein ACXWBN_15240 [Acidimicrobiales bacterium]